MSYRAIWSSTFDEPTPIVKAVLERNEAIHFADTVIPTLVATSAHVAAVIVAVGIVVGVAAVIPELEAPRTGLVEVLDHTRLAVVEVEQLPSSVVQDNVPSFRYA